MLPTLISREVEEGIKSFLRTTFPSSTPAFEGTLEAFLGEPGHVFKGPYYGLRLPFRPAPPGALPFSEITFPYRPHLHQARAFARLCGERRLSTLVATGTGSGKTECFLYPILEHCAARAGESGIKAILIYPMNALATDQAKRIAHAIHADPKLRGRVTAGLFIGGEGETSASMSADSIITDKAYLRGHPPDILLTNYKMLDFLLLRPEAQSLWQHNGPGTLQFLVVDELHTFDGAQSTDLACLVRRLKARLRTPAGQLCCVGTSATLGSAGSSQPLVEYANTVFAEPFDADCVIGEDLLGLGDVVHGYYIRYHGVPDPASPSLLPDHAARDPGAYLAAQHRLWFDTEPPADMGSAEARLSLGDRLREHSFFRNLLTLVERSGRKVVAEEWLLHELVQMMPAGVRTEHARRLLDSFLALCAHARHRHASTDGVGRPGPLLRVHVHLWARELSRLVASVGPVPAMAFSDDLRTESLRSHLPVVHCRECGAMGWGGTMRAMAGRVSPDLPEFYKAFFGSLPTLRLAFPVVGGENGSPAQGEFTHALCGKCLAVHEPGLSRCPACGEESALIQVLLHDRTKRVRDQTMADTACPYCESASGLTILGSRAASLTSVALSQLYTSPFNGEKQALAFSDNVQDASHRSGFFAARTFRVNLRTAIRKVLSHAKAPPTLAGLEQSFLDFWRQELGELDFIGTFLAPNMEWLADYDSLVKHGKLPPGSNLVKWVERRIAWEITAEFGFNSRIGRTLEKSGAAIAFADPARMASLPGLLKVRLREKAGGFGNVAESELRSVLMGLHHRLRTQGGIDHAELETYVERGGDTYLLNQQHHMPSFGRHVRAPSFFHQGAGRFQRFERVVAGGTSWTWAQRWVAKAIRSLSDLSAASAAVVLEEAIGVLVESGLLKERNVLGDRVWGIPGDQIKVTREVQSMTCGRCGHSMCCAPDEAEAWNGAPCLRSSCHGSYSPRQDIRDYFGDLYRSGDVVRIRAAEHTGLLDRETREWVENRFMARAPERRSTDPNLLSCTPTLEMGVNIGDLSSVVLCTVPPATANYLQRVGRAGRTEGAAVSLAIANAQPHDLYYFELPEDMMAGEVRPPGTFLNAPAVLERQFTAYCLDRWSERPHPRPVLPHRIESVLEAVQNPDDHAGFPFDLFRFIEPNLDMLLEGFLGLFAAGDLSQDSRGTLERFARGGEGHEISLVHKVLRELTRLAEERSEVRLRLQKVGAAIKRNRDAVARDESVEAELEELKQTRDGLHDILKQINEQPTLNFFTDAGLLPNYAFPEEGVELRSIILRKREKPKADEGKYQALTFEYVRPAASAITELAPGNVFYVAGRRLRIDQVVVNENTLQKWHFCDACSHMELVSDTQPNRTDCPSCGSPNWADASLKRDLVKLRQVVSTATDRSSRSHDDKDERDLAFFSRHESIVIPEDAERLAYQIRGASVPFGFEFLGKLTLRVVNLGQDGPANPVFRLGGRDVSSGGFVLCPGCGKVQPPGHDGDDAELKHDLSCRHRGKPSSPLKAVFLYRELTSEAIRVLLPSSGADHDTDMTSFVAALHLGLRLYFKGNIEHLKGCVDERVVEGTQLRRRYLVLYDQVPGGTGYLKQLSRTPQVFLEVLRRALDHLQACTCATRQDHDTDGCHRCILQARHRRDHATLSRTTAIRLLGDILHAADQLERVDTVSTIDIHPLIQSQLELAFLESLRAVPGSQLQSKIVRGRLGYLWRCKDTAWEVMLQVKASQRDGVDVASIPDFVLYPVRAENGRPVAVFLDGFRFHADTSAGCNRVAMDVQQRQALVHSGKFWVWSFSWEDIQFRNDPSRIPLELLGERFAERRAQLAQQILSGDDLDLMRRIASLSSWDLLLAYLSRPLSNFWERLSYLYALALPETLRPVSMAGATATVDSIAYHPVPHLQPPGAPPHDGLVGTWVADGYAGITVASQAAIRERDVGGVFVALRFDDDHSGSNESFPRLWRGFLRLLNRVQFLPNTHVFTLLAVKSGNVAGVTDGYRRFLNPDTNVPGVTPAHTDPRHDWPPDLEHADRRILACLAKLAAASRAWPVVGFELEADARIIATAEAAWPDARVALIPEGMPLDKQSFETVGWTVWTYGPAGPDEDTLNALLSSIPSRP